MTRPWGPTRWDPVLVSVLVSVLVALLPLTIVPTAAAHTETLAGSTPGAGSLVRSLDTIELRFVDTIQPDAATFTLRSSSGTSHPLATPTYRQDDRVVILRAGAPVPDGRYRVGYQVVFGDGDPAVGVVEFEISADGVARAPAWPAGDPLPTVPRQRFGGASALPWLVGGAVAAVAALAIVLARSRRREASDRPEPGPA